MPRKAPYGVHRGFIAVAVDLLTGTSAREFLTDLVPGFTLTVEKVSYVCNIIHTGSGSQTIRVVKGASTVVASKIVVLADTGTAGLVVDMPVTAADATFSDTDTLTVDMTASGTAFTTGTATVLIRYRANPQRVS
jgi:hypothetical protein